MARERSETTTVMPAAARAASVLREEIRGGRYAIGERLSNERELASTLGVSRETIRQSLKILSNERLIVSQHGRGTFVTNPTYSSHSNSTETSLIGAMVYEKEYYFGAILQGAFSHATRRGFMLATGMNDTEEAENEHLEAFIKSGIKGLIFVPRNLGKHSSQTYDRLAEENIPLVMLDNRLPDRYEDFVTVDDFHGTTLATRYVIELGHTRIGYVEHDNPDDVPSQPERLLGFLNACRLAGIHVPDSYVIKVNQDTIGEQTAAFMQQSDPPTALVFYNDYLAVRTFEVIRELNLRVPEDLSIVGFDDSLLARNCAVPITTVSPQPHELGRTAVDLLVGKIESSQPQTKRSVLIAPRLVVRESTAPPKIV